MRTDKNTGKQYTEHNIPMDRVHIIVLPKVAQFCIMNEYYGHESDVWYNDTFCGDRYAVFKRTRDGMVWQQTTTWYQRFGYAQRKMFEQYNKLFTEKGGEHYVH